jgi:hypothetical protein
VEELERVFGTELRGGAETLQLTCPSESTVEILIRQAQVSGSWFGNIQYPNSHVDLPSEGKAHQTKLSL